MADSLRAVTLALDHLDAGRIEQAHSVLKRALEKNPRDPHLARVMCNTMLLKMERHQALHFARLALRHAPDEAEFFYSLGRVMRQFAPYPELFPVFEKAVTLDPTHREAWVGLTEAHLFGLDFVAAAEAARRALDHFPGGAALLGNLSVALQNLSQADEAAEILRQAVVQHPREAMLAYILAAALNYASTATPEESAKAHRRAGQILADFSARQRATNPPTTPLPPRPVVTAADRDRPLRIGFLSPDFRSHAVSLFFRPIARALDQSQFAIVGYSTTTDPDHATRELASLCSAWRNVPLVEDDALERIIRTDAVDVLIDLAGLTAGQSLLLFTRRIAPVQVTYLGYPNTTGIPAMDYRLVDSLTDPPGTWPPGTDDLATEKLVRLDPCFLCFAPPPDLGELPAIAPREPDAPVVFGSFNMHKKVNEPLLDLWTRILEAVPGSRLLLKNTALGSAVVRDDLTARMARRGIAADRLELLGNIASHAGHLRLYNRVDVALDTYPYCGTTTTCEALSMGVPVVSLVGPSHHSRVGLSLLSAVGHPEWCANTRDEYVARAVGLGSAAAAAPRTDREALRAAMLASPLCDEPGFALRFGAALRAMWLAHVETKLAAAEGKTP
jgi:predicted O-linked N-acetylglucosamine transferase (SPINDLY family)